MRHVVTLLVFAPITIVVTGALVALDVVSALVEIRRGDAVGRYS